MVVASRCVPLWAEGDGLRGVRKGHHQGPAGRHLHRVQRLDQRRGQVGGAQQFLCLQRRLGQQHTGEAGKHVGCFVPAFVFAFGVQLPMFFVQRVARDAQHLGAELDLALERLGPGFDQGVHAGLGHPVRFAVRQGGFHHAAHGVEHAHGVGAPGLAHAGRGFNGLRKAGVAHGEVLRAMVKAAKGGAAGAHAPAHASALFKDGHLVTGLNQGASASDAGNAGADDGEMFCHAPTLHALHAILGLQQRALRGFALQLI